MAVVMGCMICCGYSASNDTTYDNSCFFDATMVVVMWVTNRPSIVIVKPLLLSWVLHLYDSHWGLLCLSWHHHWLCVHDLLLLDYRLLLVDNRLGVDCRRLRLICGILW